MNTRISLFISFILAIAPSACDPDYPALNADDLSSAESDEPCDDEVEKPHGKPPQAGRPPKSDGRSPKSDGRSPTQDGTSNSEDDEPPELGLASHATPELANSHPVRGCWMDSHCANRCGCIDSICQPSGTAPLPSQEYCNYPPEVHEGDYVSCSYDSDCADHCTRV